MIEFDKEKHEYRVDGRLVPSVTQIISAFQPEKKFSYPESAASRGWAVHDLTDEIDSGAPLFSDNPIYNYGKAYVDFLSASGAVVQDRGIIVHRDGKMPYAGTIDKLVLFPDKPELGVVGELKSGAKQAWHYLQAAAYAIALEAETKCAHEFFLLYLTKTGKFRLDYPQSRWQVRYKLEWEKLLWAYYTSQLF